MRGKRFHMGEKTLENKQQRNWDLLQTFTELFVYVKAKRWCFLSQYLWSYTVCSFLLLFPYFYSICQQKAVIHWFRCERILDLPQTWLNVIHGSPLLFNTLMHCHKSIVCASQLFSLTMRHYKIKLSKENMFCLLFG